MTTVAQGPLAGRRCLLTGAGGALGAATALALRQAGADLVLCGRSDARLAELVASLRRLCPDGGCLETIVADLSDDAGCEGLAGRVIDSGRLDGLINNAAVQGPIGPIWENDWAAWRACLTVNLLAPVALCRALVPLLGQRRRDGADAGQGRGKIINLSGGGATAPRPNFTAYGVAKTGLARFTETLAQEVGDRGIDVNAVAPGVIASSLTKAVLAAGAERSGAREAAIAERVLGEGNASVEREAAALIAWLASSGSDGVTGRLISAVWDPWRDLAQRRETLADSDIYTLRRIVPEDRGRPW